MQKVTQKIDALRRPKTARFWDYFDEWVNHSKNLWKFICS